MNRSAQAFRQVVAASLSNTPLSYQINNNAPQTLPTANVVPEGMWDATAPPMPLVAYDVQRTGFRTRKLYESSLALMFRVVSNSGPDEANEIAEALINRFHTADQDTEGPADLSRAPTSSLLGVAVRKCELVHGGWTVYDKTVNRWQRVLEFSVIAN